MIFRKPPTLCDNCGSNWIKLITNDQVYGELKGDWPYCYKCFRCSALASCHKGTYNPMGLMATSTTRRRRVKLHELFDILWLHEYCTRAEAYKWLANELKIGNDCHISELTVPQLKEALDLMHTHKENGYAFFKRRKSKNENRRTAAATRQDRRIKLRRYGKS